MHDTFLNFISMARGINRNRDTCVKAERLVS
jgi:hypothetical protein